MARPRVIATVIGIAIPIEPREQPANAPI